MENGSPPSACPRTPRRPRRADPRQLPVPVHARRASPDDRSTAYRIRALASVSAGWARPGDFPDGMERDEFDDVAVHVLGWDGRRAGLHRAAGVPARPAADGGGLRPGGRTARAGGRRRADGGPAFPPDLRSWRVPRTAVPAVPRGADGRFRGRLRHDGRARPGRWSAAWACDWSSSVRSASTTGSRGRRCDSSCRPTSSRSWTGGRSGDQGGGPSTRQAFTPPNPNEFDSP